MFIVGGFSAGFIHVVSSFGLGSFGFQGLTLCVVGFLGFSHVIMDFISVLFELVRKINVLWLIWKDSIITFFRISSYLTAKFLRGSATCALNESASIIRSLLRFSVSSSIVVQVVSEADSSDPGVICGVSPTVNEADFLAFFSKNLFDKALQDQLHPRRGNTSISVHIHVR